MSLAHEPGRRSRSAAPVLLAARVPTKLLEKSTVCWRIGATNLCQSSRVGGPCRTLAFGRDDDPRLLAPHPDMKMRSHVLACVQRTGPEVDQSRTAIVRRIDATEASRASKNLCNGVARKDVLSRYQSKGSYLEVFELGPLAVFRRRYLSCVGSPYSGTHRI